MAHGRKAAGVSRSNTGPQGAIWRKWVCVLCACLSNVHEDPSELFCIITKLERQDLRILNNNPFQKEDQFSYRWLKPVILASQEA
jgi:hypothetical protein